MDIEVEPVICLACGSDDRDEFADGRVQCGECGWPVYAEASAYLAMGLTPDGRMLPNTVEVWAPCEVCGLADDDVDPPSSGPATCPECGQALVPWRVRVLTPQAVLEQLRARRAGQRSFDDKEIKVGDSVVVSSRHLVGSGPHTLLFVLAVHEDGELDLARDSDGTTWLWVPGEYAFRV